MPDNSEEDRQHKSRQNYLRWSRAVIAITTALAGGLTVSTFFGQFFYNLKVPILDSIPRDAVITVFSVLVTITIAAAYILSESQRSQSAERLERVEDEFRQNPEKPQLAWDLARSKLENYLDRNLAQATWIFWLTILVMAAGFSVVVFGVIKSFEQPTALAVSIVSSASGIIISFLGASFLLIYRSVAEQTRGYVSVLERINAVGMAVQVLTTVSDDAKDLKNQATAALAKQLLDLYGISKPL